MKPVKNKFSANNPESREENTNLKGMFVHHVFFWLKEPENKDQVEKFKMELERLVLIDSIRFKHIGVPA